jgi:hypothetical protein
MLNKIISAFNLRVVYNYFGKKVVIWWKRVLVEKRKVYFWWKRASPCTYHVDGLPLFIDLLTLIVFKPNILVSTT